MPSNLPRRPKKTRAELLTNATEYAAVAILIVTVLRCADTNPLAAALSLALAVPCVIVLAFYLEG